MQREYIMDSASELGLEQLGYLEALFDAPTKGVLDMVEVQPGWRCLDLGAGAGSITRWLAERTGPTGSVVAVDIDTEQLDEQSGVQVYRHDINNGLPVAGTFELIHARMVLMHLRRREQILETLVDALAPGGWLVLGESVDRPQRVLSAPSEADAELADRVVHAGMHDVAGTAGVSWTWAREVDGHMGSAGLVNISALEHCRTITGNSDGSLLNSNYVRQTEQGLLRAGITREEQERFHALMRDPGFRAWPFFKLVFTRGQKPRQETVGSSGMR